MNTWFQLTELIEAMRLNQIVNICRNIFWVNINNGREQSADSCKNNRLFEFFIKENENDRWEVVRRRYENETNENKTNECDAAYTY